MKSSTHILLSVIAPFVLTGCSRTAAPEIPTEQIQTGDILLRRGEGIVSRVVTSSDIDGKYSHIGVAVTTGEGIMAVHAVPGEHDSENDFDRVKIEPVTKFFASNAATKGAIARYPLSTAQQDEIGRQAIDIARRKIRFDHKYDLSDTTKLYCTELIKLLYSRVGIDINEGRTTGINFPPMTGDYIMPSDIYKNKKLRTIFQY